MKKQEEAPIKVVESGYKKLAEEYNQKLSKASNPENLNELKLTWAGKLFFASVAAYLASGAVAKRMPIKVRGNKQQMEALAKAIVGSKAFQREMKKPGATVDSVMDKMNLKNMTAQNFKQLTGVDWPL